MTSPFASIWCKVKMGFEMRSQVNKLITTVNKKLRAAEKKFFTQKKHPETNAM